MTLVFNLSIEKATVWIRQSRAEQSIHTTEITLDTTELADARWFTREEVAAAMNGDADGKPVPTLLWERGVVPFLKVDKGLADEKNGVQLMKPIPDLDSQCKAAVAKGMFGTKMRSVINKANAEGIAASMTMAAAVQNIVRAAFALSRDPFSKRKPIASR